MSRLALFAATLAAGCAPGSYSDLDRPTIAVSISEGGGFCSSVHAVDGAGAVWASGGCGEESGSLVRRDRVVSAADRASLDAQMDDVLALSDDPECDLVSPSARRYRFARALPSGDELTVRQCEPVPLVVTQLANRLEALSSPTTLDAGVTDAAP